MEVFWGAALIFCLRICDVSIGTVKLLYIVRGRRLVSALLAFFESSVWIVAASLVFSHSDHPWNMVGFCAGFATGTACGMTIERWIASGHVLLRIVSRAQGPELLQALRDHGFGLTTVHAEGKEGRVMVLLVVTLRKRSKEALELVKSVEPQAFVTIDPVSPAVGGFLYPSTFPRALRK